MLTALRAAFVPRQPDGVVIVSSLLRAGAGRPSSSFALAVARTMLTALRAAFVPRQRDELYVLTPLASFALAALEQ